MWNTNAGQPAVPRDAAGSGLLAGDSAQQRGLARRRGDLPSLCQAEWFLYRAAPQNSRRERFKTRKAAIAAASAPQKPISRCGPDMGTDTTEPSYPKEEDSPFDRVAFVAFAARKHGWIVIWDGGTAGLVAGDMGYEHSRVTLGVLAVHALAETGGTDTGERIKGQSPSWSRCTCRRSEARPLPLPRR
jgi:hypothetical protein